MKRIFYLLLICLVPNIYAQDWEKLTSNTEESISSIAYGNDTLICVGNDGLVLVSHNLGEDWVENTTVINDSLSKVVFGNGAFICLGDSGLYTSFDNGTTWDKTSSLPIVDLDFGNGIFVAVASNNNSSIFITSTDGITWNSNFSLPNPDDACLQTITLSEFVDVTFANGQFLITGYATYMMYKLVFGFGTFYYTKSNLGVILDSEDGIHWDRWSYGDWDSDNKKFKYFKNVHDIRDVVDNNLLIGQNNQLLFSSSVFTWDTVQISDTINDFIFDEYKVIAIGNSGTIIESIDCEHWTQDNIETDTNLYDIICADNYYFIVGEKGLILKKEMSAIPAPIADFSADITSGDIDLAVSFTDNSTGDISSWSWDFGDGSSSTDQSPSHTYTVAGTYTVSLTVTGTGGSDTETKTDYITVTSVPPPVADFSISWSENGTNFNLGIYNASTGDISSWLWDFGDGSTSTEKQPAHSYSEAGTYTISLTATGAGGSNTKTEDIILMYTSPNASFYSDVTSGEVDLLIKFIDESYGNFSNWLWDFGDMSTSTEQNPSHTYTEVGMYTVSLTVTGPGGSDTETKTDYITVTTPTGISGLTTEDNILIFPNPTKSICKVIIPNEISGKVNIKIFNTNGEELISKTAISEKYYELNLSELSVGVYNISIISGTNILTDKLIVTE